MLHFLCAKTAEYLPWILRAGTTSRSLETEMASRASTIPNAPVSSLGVSVCRYGSVLWSRVAHGGPQRSLADCKVPGLQRAAEVVWYFHVFAARVKCSHPDAPANVGRASLGDETSLPGTVITRQPWRNRLRSVCEVSTNLSDARLIDSSN